VAESLWPVWLPLPFRVKSNIFNQGPPGGVMSPQKQELNSVIPDLRDLPLERLAELGDSVLAHSIDRYRQRLKETGVPLSSFQARI
jgi:FXSXX-COOH protein